MADHERSFIFCVSKVSHVSVGLVEDMFLYHPKLLYSARMPTTQHHICFASFFPGGDFNSKVAKSSAKNTKTFLFWDFQYWQASTAIPDERKFLPFQGKKSSTATQKEKTERKPLGFEVCSLVVAGAEDL